MYEGYNKKQQNPRKQQQHEEDEEFGVSKHWKDSYVEVLITLQGEMTPNYLKNMKKCSNLYNFFTICTICYNASCSHIK